jgi:hypothetical protein
MPIPQFLNAFEMECSIASQASIAYCGTIGTITKRGYKEFLQFDL